MKLPVHMPNLSILLYTLAITLFLSLSNAFGGEGGIVTDLVLLSEGTLK